jgi:succinyl-CoA synthetase beta subunit
VILSEFEAKRLLEEASIPVVPVIAASNPDEAKTAAERTGYPVVLKFSSSRYTHKTEIGGVFLNLKNEIDLQNAYRSLEELRDRLDPSGKIILEAMAPEGAELFIGVQRHPQFGPVMSLGIGGVWLELFHDVTFRLLPARDVDFREMLSELKTWPKFSKGFRHLPPVDGERIVELMQKVAQFALSRPQLKEMDLNPIIAGASGVSVVDAAIVTIAGIMEA